MENLTAQLFIDAMNGGQWQWRVTLFRPDGTVHTNIRAAESWPSQQEARVRGDIALKNEVERLGQGNVTNRSS